MDCLCNCLIVEKNRSCCCILFIKLFIVENVVVRLLFLKMVMVGTFSEGQLNGSNSNPLGSDNHLHPALFSSFIDFSYARSIYSKDVTVYSRYFTVIWSP